MIKTEDITIRLANLPPKIKAYTVYTDDHYTIVINDSLSMPGRLKAYRHELYHIEHDDFCSEKRYFWRQIIKEIRFGIDRKIEVLFL